VSVVAQAAPGAEPECAGAIEPLAEAPIGGDAEALCDAR
jgi:hypothetical protein